MPKPILIGLAGKKQAGKSSVTEYLAEEYGFREISWAEPLKDIIGMELLGLTEKQVYGTEIDKETVDPFWGKSPRELLQVIGTDCFREKVHPEFWVKLGERRIRELLADGQSVVVSDCRFPNELDSISRLRGHSIRVIRIGQESKDQHTSEIALDGYSCDFTVSAQTGDLPGLYDKVATILTALRVE
jgi:hypothetical protein